MLSTVPHELKLLLPSSPKAGIKTLLYHTVSYIESSLEYLNDGVHLKWVGGQRMPPSKALWNQVPFINHEEGGEYSVFLERIERRVKSGQKENFWG